MTPQKQVKVSIALKDIAKRIDRDLHKAAGERVPFSLYMWIDGRVQYVANVERPDAIALMAEFFDKQTQGYPDMGAPHLDGVNEPTQ